MSARDWVLNVRTAVAAGLVVGAGLLSVSLAAPSAVDAPVEQPTDSVTVLLDDHDCWTGDAPADVIPGSAVVALPSASPAIVPASVGFGVWLDGEPGTVYGFCPDALPAQLPACEYDDSTGCVWVADERGNRIGRSFIVDDAGVTTYVSHDEARAAVSR